MTVFGKPRYLGVAAIEDDVINFDGKHQFPAVIQTVRGVELGIIGGKISPEQQEIYRSSSLKYEDTTESMIQEIKFDHAANPEEIEKYYDLKFHEEDVLLRSREILKSHNLKIKLVDVEYMLDQKKLFFYFTSEQRIDFRSYVRDLAHEFKTRIEMRQIGTRDEARIVRGIASCGRECCCGYWLRGFSPIGIKMVKEQRMTINPTKISGICGRLMCCMSYEQALYSELWEKLPGPGSRIKTEQGIYTLESLDIGRELVNIRFPSNRLVPVKISEFESFRDTVLKGEEWENNQPVKNNSPVAINVKANHDQKQAEKKSEPPKKSARVTQKNKPHEKSDQDSKDLQRTKNQPRRNNNKQRSNKHSNAQKNREA